MMKCRDFDRNLADWVRGRLDAAEAERMAGHAIECRSCAEEAETERSLRASFQTFAPITRTPDLWERIEARVETARQPRFGWVHRFQRQFALGGAVAAAGLLMLLMTSRGPVAPVPQGVDESRTVQLITDMHIPEMEPAGTYSETPNSGEAVRMMLVGK